VLASLAEFERDLLRERVRSGLAAAKARGVKLGRQPGHRPKSDRLAPRVLGMIETGTSYRDVAKQLKLSKNTIAEIVKRARLS
jgi:putative DNA-invertase from lambdoid prophage Rac